MCSAPVFKKAPLSPCVNCRAVSGRRVDVRGAFLMNILALCAAQQPVLTALSGDGVEQKTQALQHVEFLCAPEKLCTALNRSNLCGQHKKAPM